MSNSNQKIKIRSGRDANISLVRKLARNFITSGKLTTTVKRAKILKSVMDKLTSKARDKKESSRNVLLKHLGAAAYVDKLISQIDGKFGERTGGYVRLVKVGARLGDGAQMAQLTWVEPIANIKTEIAPPAVKDEPKPVKVAAIKETSKNKKTIKNN